MSNASLSAVGPYQADERTEVLVDDIQADSWFSVGSIALGVFAFVTTEFIPVGIIPEIAVDLRVPLGTAGLMLTVPGLISAISAPALILAGGRLDRRTVLLALSILLLTSNVVSSTAPNFTVMLLSRAILGCCLGGFWTLALAAGIRLVRARSVTRSISIVMSGMTCATVLGLPLGTLIGTIFTWRMSFLVTAALAAAALVAQLCFLPRLPSQSHIRVGDFVNLLRRRPTQASLGLAALLFGSNIASYTYLTPFLETDAAMGRGSVTPILLVFGVVGFLANLIVVPLVATRLRTTLCLLIVSMIVVMFAMPVLARSHAGVILLLAIWAVPFGAVPLCLSDWTHRSASDLPEAISALFISTVQLSIGLGSVGAATMVAAVGVPGNLWLGGGLAAAGLLVVSLPSSAKTSIAIAP